MKYLVPFFLLCLLLLVTGLTPVNAQADRMPYPTSERSFTLQSHGEDQPEVMWDIQFSHNVSDTVGSLGLAGATFFQNQFWISRWQSDTLYTLDANGGFLAKFTIPGISGTRAFTHDDTSLYIANASNTVYQVNPSTRTILRTFSVPALATSTGGTTTTRWITFDPTADGGAGGFWHGNFNTEIGLVNMSGTRIAAQTIPFATHGLTGMYGAALDTFSATGPYLWVFSQGQAVANSQGEIRVINLATGTPSLSDFRDASADFNNPAGLAGGMFISDEIVTGEVTLGGLLQGTPNVLFGYELDFTPISVDAATSDLSYSPPYGQIPSQFTPNWMVNFDGTVVNNGQSSANVEVEIDVNDGSMSVFSATNTINNLVPGTTSSFGITNSWTPGGTGDYEITAVSSILGQTDGNPANDSAFQEIQVTDSVYGRDNGVTTNSYLVGTAGGMFVTPMDFPEATAISGIEVVVVDLVANAGVDITPIIVALDANGAPTGNPVATGPAVSVSTDSLMYLPLDASYGIAANSSVAIGFIHGAAPGGLIGASIFNYVAGVNFFSTDVVNPNWTPSGIQTIRQVRAVLDACGTFFVASRDSSADTGSSDGAASITVAGNTGQVTYLWTDANGNQVSTSQLATGLAAGTYTVVATDGGTGCTTTARVTVPGCTGFTTLGTFATLDDGSGNGTAQIVVSGNVGPVTYSWTDANGNPVGSTSTISGLAAGTYNVTVTDQLGCFITETLVVPGCSGFSIAQIDTFPDNGTMNGAINVVLSGANGPANFEVTDNNGNVVGTTANTTGLAAGTYTLTIGDSLGCEIVTEVTIGSNVSIDRELAGIRTFEVFPNPTQSTFRLRLELTQPQQLDIQLLDARGRMLVQREVARTQMYSDDFDLGAQAAGVYVLRIQTERGTSYLRVVRSN